MERLVLQLTPYRDARDVFLVGYADDVVAVITARNLDLAQRKLDQVSLRVRGWMASHGLQLANSKTEIVMLTKRRIPSHSVQGRE